MRKTYCDACKEEITYNIPTQFLHMSPYFNSLSPNHLYCKQIDLCDKCKPGENEKIFKLLIKVLYENSL